MDEHMKILLSMMSESERMDWLSKTLNFAEGSLMYYKILARKYDDILRLELIKDPITKLRIVCRPNYDIGNVMKFTEELLLGVEYEIVVQGHETLS